MRAGEDEDQSGAESGDSPGEQSAEQRLSQRRDAGDHGADSMDTPQCSCWAVGGRWRGSVERVKMGRDLIESVRKSQTTDETHSYLQSTCLHSSHL